MNKNKLNHKITGTAGEDPNAGIEAQKYDSPVASRDFIRQVLEERGAPLDFDQLIDRFNLADQPDSQEALRRRVSAMIRDGQLVRNRKGGLLPVDESDLAAGHISAHPDGFGFLVVDSDSDIYLNGKQMRQVLHGDRAVVCVTGVDRRGRREGRIVDVLERANHQVVGRFLSEQGINFIAPDNKRIHQDLLIPENATGSAKPGDMVIAQIVEQPTMKRAPVGRVSAILGQHLKAGMETDVAIASHGIPFEWPEAVNQFVQSFDAEVNNADKEDRKDVRKLPLLTIDGEDARDFDDAVYCERKDEGWRLFVAIADVSHYVEPGSPLDQEAKSRGTSVYFPSRVVPMLPEVLSNGLCSLNPQVDRLCLLCEMTLDANGSIKRTRFHKAVMRSHARLTYTQVGAMLEQKDKLLREEYSVLVPHLENLYALYKLLVKTRMKRGAIEFESNETRILFDDQQKIEKIVPIVRNDAHKLIEECMILANIAAATYLEKKKLPALFRVHSPPKADRLDDLRSFLSLRGLSLDGGLSPTPLHYAKLSRSLQGRVDAGIIQTVMLRSMQQAVYQPVNEGHFGLAITHYAHFTSPIRRYPDLLVHRAIAHALTKGKLADYWYTKDDMFGLGENCSMTERRADEATRDVTSWLKCEYMQAHVGDQFDGVVSSVTSFGLFVQLSDIFVEGLVHITSLGEDYYHFDQAAHTLNGERSGASFSLGDSIQVTVAAVNLEERKIDFTPADTPVSKSASPYKGKGKKRGAQRSDLARDKSDGALSRKQKAKRKAKKKLSANKSSPKTGVAKKSTAKKSATGKSATQPRQSEAKKLSKAQKVRAEKLLAKKARAKKAKIKKNAAKKAQARAKTKAKAKSNKLNANKNASGKNRL